MRPDVVVILTDEERAGDPGALRVLHARQAWRLAHWELERDGVTHRRFFNVTGLIGMRVEDEQVFEDTHALILDLVRGGWVQGIRVDHVDGLADPGTYLQRLRAAVAAKAPIKLTVKKGERLRQVTIAYAGGPRYPVLIKTGTGETGLDRLLAPR